jgi:hypothetical protein
MADQKTAPVDPSLGYWYTPLAGKHYPSPLYVSGFCYLGSAADRKVLTAYFFGPYGEVSFDKGFSFTSYDFAFSIDLAPGPYDVNWNIGVVGREFEQMTHIQKFYVRTPPE